ncbi:hypothetical protein HNQ77_002399 [Silvibacterium bohemicum]|uniref:Uncharacterized protein n=1 Tax=Silvibacterium bohemicum TaxID=1577686 RepID=A0A841JVF1_9BACT|nr:hypothetical protein [Silvibacterium bohemicum]
MAVDLPRTKQVKAKMRIRASIGLARPFHVRERPNSCEDIISSQIACRATLYAGRLLHRNFAVFAH